MSSAEPSRTEAAAPASFGPPRRAVLRRGLGGLTGALVLTAAAGCRLRIGAPGSGSAPGRGQPQPPAAPTADPAALATAAGTATALQLAYGQAIAVRLDLAAPLTWLLDDHTAHLRALTALGVSVPSPTTSATPGSTSTGPQVTATTALSVLAQLERDGAASALAELAALDDRTARLLASIAACRSSHVTLLARLPATPPTATAKAGA